MRHVYTHCLSLFFPHQVATKPQRWWSFQQVLVGIPRIQVHCCMDAATDSWPLDPVTSRHLKADQGPAP
jgi:hypothetical protein